MNLRTEIDDQVPVSPFHDTGRYGGPGSWWGANLSKFVVMGSDVYMLHQDNGLRAKDSGNPHMYVIRKVDHGWDKISPAYPCLRPGNLLANSKGSLFLIYPYNHEGSHSRATIKVIEWRMREQSYTPVSTVHLIDGFKKNIRIGAAISDHDRITLAWGNSNNQMIVRTMDEHGHWRDEQRIDDDNLTSNFYYPRVLRSPGNIQLCAIQDDDDLFSEGNIYQQILYGSVIKGKGSVHVMQDLSGHWLAKYRNRLVQLDDLYRDSYGEVHMIWSERLHASDPRLAVHTHMVRGKDSPKSALTLNYSHLGIRYIRLLEINRELFYLMTSHSRAFIMSADRSEEPRDLGVPGLLGIYPFIARAESGSRFPVNEAHILLMSGSRRAWDLPAGPKNAYVKLTEVA